MTMQRSSAVRRAVPRTGSVLVGCDFDGTLSNIVSDPTLAVPVPQALSAIQRLAGNQRTLVEVISARPAGFVASKFPGPDGKPMSGISFSGQYGRQRFVGGAVQTLPELNVFRPAIAAVAQHIRSEFGPKGVRVEDLDGIGLTLHLRELFDRDPAEAARVEAELRISAAQLAETHHLVAEPARLAIEVITPGRFDKGTVIRTALAANGQIRSVLFLGDSIRDAPAYETLRQLKDEGLSTLGIFVDSNEADPATRGLADLVVSSPDEAATFLSELADSLEVAASRSTLNP